MVVVGGGACAGEVFAVGPCSVEVGQVYLSDFVAVAQEDVDAVVVLDEVGEAVGVGVDLFLAFVDPMA